MTSDSGVKKEKDPEQVHRPNDVERQQAAFAANFNTTVIEAHLAHIKDEERDRDEVRKALSSASVIQALESKLASSEEAFISAQQSPEEHQALMATLNGDK